MPVGVFAPLVKAAFGGICLLGAAIWFQDAARDCGLVRKRSQPEVIVQPVIIERHTAEAVPEPEPAAPAKGVKS